MTTTINGRTPDEIKKGLECCAFTDAPCTSCPFRTGTDAECIIHMSECALAYIQQLEHHIGELTEKVAQFEAERSHSHHNRRNRRYR